MNIEKNKRTYILLACGALVLAIFRHMYILNPDLGWVSSASGSLLIMEAISLLVGIACAVLVLVSRETEFEKSDYLFLLVISGVLYAACYIGAVFWFDLPDILPFMDARPLYIPDKLSQLAPYFAIVPVLMTYFYVEEDRKKRTWITLIVLAFCVITSALLRKSLTGTYLLLLVCCIVIGIKETQDKQFNWYFVGAIVILALAATVIAYVSSGCSSVEHFVIYQYENSAVYIEGGWDSAAVFDGTLVDAVQKSGFISGTTSPNNILWTGTYDAPINVLLAYGWLPFILHAISSTIVAVCCILVARGIRDDVPRNLAYVITAKIIATTLFAYFMLPRTAAPLGIRTTHFDFDLVWIIVLVAFSVRDRWEEMDDEMDEEMDGGDKANPEDLIEKDTKATDEKEADNDDKAGAKDTQKNIGESSNSLHGVAPKPAAGIGNCITATDAAQEELAADAAFVEIKEEGER